MSTIVPFGPQHPVLPEPLHLKLVLEDEIVKEALPTLGYVHRGLETLATIKDIDLRELVLFVPLIVGTIWLGVQPDLVLNYTAASVDAVVNGWQLATGG